MRLRHKKGAETDIQNHPFIIKTYKTASDFKFPNRTLELGNQEKIFGNSHPLYLELGMGKGRFITEMSMKYPAINYIGIEKSATIVLKAIDNLIAGMDAIIVGADTIRPCTGELCEPKSLLQIYPNLRFMCLDIEHLDRVFAEHSIDKIYLNFSDPWPKKRHEQRRLTHIKFLSIYEKILKPNSLIEFKTDNKDLFVFSLEQIKNSNFELLEFTYDLHGDSNLNKDNIMTEYEAKFSKQGNKICKLIAKI